jgi:hypothetical protein
MLSMLNKLSLNKGIILVVLLLTSKFAVAQDRIDSALTIFNQRYTTEKAFVHFDNSRYEAGQTIWYKAYLLNGLEPSLISKNFYIDWYDDQGKLINTTINTINYCYAFGDFKVPEKYQGKFIQAIAYTKWMRNFDSAYHFRQKFPIFSANNKQEISITNLSETTIQFLPESGSLLLNKQNVVAFKAVNQFGLPEPINGTIKNNVGDSITSFNSLHDGMGKFLLIPLENDHYSAEWKDNKGVTHNTKFPEAIKEGINLIVETGSGNRIFHIQRTETVPESMKNSILIGHMNGKVLFKANINLTNKESITSTLPLSKINSGILQLTLFDANRIPICERIVFVKNTDYQINTSIKIDTLNSFKRGKNVLEIELLDKSNANFSLAITDADLNDVPENTIVSQLLLQGDITGNINKPAYYFTSNADSIANHLDLVMMTNGWRKYHWFNIMNNKLPKLAFEKDAAYLTISGKLEVFRKEKSGILNLIIESKDSSKSLLLVPLLPDGSFEEKNVIFYDTAKIFYNLKRTSISDKSKIVFETDLLKHNLPKFTKIEDIKMDTIGLSKFQYLIDERKRFELLSKDISLKEVTVYAKKQKRLVEMDKKYTDGVFSKGDQTGFDLTKANTGTMTIFDYIGSKVPGFSINNPLGDIPVVTYNGRTTLFYVDEQLIPNENIQFINLKDIAYIKVFKVLFEGNNGGPAVAVYTKKESDIDIISEKMDYVSLIGYSPFKEFYSPSYAEKELKNSNTQDLRSTLLWNPWISLNKQNNKIKILFYNNDITHSFRVTMEGMDSKGKLIHISNVFK